MTKRIPVGVFFALFTISGFAGLIYESIWTHYLKLFLGHAAYAQTLVLAIFMGGMALGSWLVSRFTGRITNLLYGYALAELGIGLLAVVFHRVFVGATDWGFETVIPALGSPFAVDLFKWLLASVLILPASVLLGSTFPLMSAGIIRLHPERSGAALAWLYFTNSLGAAIGVIASGFFLIDKLGLPGTILTAGLLNVTLALVVWVLAKKIGPVAAETPGGRHELRGGRVVTVIQVVALVTGAASFIYEITWIRMLTMGLGASTHSFEVMLSAFILGMAMGGIVLALRTPREGSDLLWLSAILVAKGMFAVGALASYGAVLDFIQWMLAAIKNTGEGYTLLNVGGQVASMAVMFPSAFCAGMTLPLATAILIRRGAGESAIGRVYAANTAGCIVGAAFATHVGMESLGLKGLTGFGAACDIALGAAVVVLLVGRSRVAMAALAATAAAGAVSFAMLDLDTLKMASGVFRYGIFLDPRFSRVEFYKDGKTATIAVTTDGKFKTIRTNGKPDAGVQFAAGERPAWDESTMILLAALPLSLKPDARDFANIGFGSGLSTHTLLTHAGVRSVDTIEIEPVMVEGARAFERFNSLAYTDPRSHIRIDDAKTFFAAHQSTYDVILAEPSNPWVSGVATLFSDEFYARIRPHIRPGGLLVQWLQVYEIDFDLVSSILKALGRNFADYRIYTTQPGDILVVATKEGPVPPLTDGIINAPGIRDSLRRIGYRSLAEMGMEQIASRRVIEPLVNRSRYPVNSDYFPVVDLHAAEARFRNLSARDIAGVPKTFVPFSALIDGDTRIAKGRVGDGEEVGSTRTGDALTASAMVDVFLTTRTSLNRFLQPSGRLQVILARTGMQQCDIEPVVWIDAIEDMMRTVLASIHGPEVDDVFARIESSPCYRRLEAPDRDRIALYKAFHRRDTAMMISTSERLLASGRAWPPGDVATFSLASISARIATGDLEGARKVWAAHGSRFPAALTSQLPVRVVLAHLGLDLAGLADIAEQPKAAPEGR